MSPYYAVRMLLLAGLSCLVSITVSAQRDSEKLSDARFLAADCMLCHSVGIPTLAGRSKFESLVHLHELKMDTGYLKVMSRVLSAYSDEELNLIASIFSQKIPELGKKNQ